MELKQGYKQTELGVIPKDWEVKELCEILKFGSGKDYKHLALGDYPVYGTGGIMTYVDSFLYEGESDGIGRKGTIDKPVFLNGKFWTVDTLFYTHTFTNILPKFVYYNFLNIPWREYNEASGVPSLNKNTLDKIKVALPPLEEQKAIAELLSDVDELIAQTERLIAKKEAIKLGLMQELLRPKEGWISRKLKELVSTPITDGPHETPNFVEEGVPFLSVNNIANNRLTWNGVRFISKEDDTIFSKKCKPCKGDILFGKAASVGKVALVDTDENFNIWSPLALIRPNSEISNRFLYYYLQSGQVSRQINFYTNSSSQGNIGMGDIERIEINLPATQLVQQAIVEVLSEVDEELQLMRDLSFKYEQLKSALTNQLLSGKIRLV